MMCVKLDVKQWVISNRHILLDSALMPHGTPCDAKIFGCDDAFLGGTKEFDECGVCGGDGSTCDVIQGTFTDIPGEGNLFRDI
uniref:Uncharacterized protein n=1 Tax=Magallana gigas TaxID=29159 RepID=A0A8W8IWC0_MAGGI